jgi:hypothetical protein
MNAGCPEKVKQASTANVQVKTKKASDFVRDLGIFEPVRATDRDMACHRAWTQIREPFLLPKCICDHKARFYFMGNKEECLGRTECHKNLYRLDKMSAEVGCRASTREALEQSRRKILGVRGSKPLISGISAQRNAQFKDDSWEVYDYTLAGCLMCGSMHVCVGGQCPVETNDEGHEICTITGLIVKMLSFSNEEFVDTISTEYETTVFLQSKQRGRRNKSTAALFEHADESMDGVHAGVKRGWGVANGSLSVGGQVGSSAQLPFSKKRGSSSRSIGLCQEDQTDPDSFTWGSKWTAGHHASTQHSISTLSSAPSSSLHHMNPNSSNVNNVRCSVNKKNRYRSWVYHKVMQQPAKCTSFIAARGEYSFNGAGQRSTRVSACSILQFSDNRDAYQQHRQTTGKPAVLQNHRHNREQASAQGGGLNAMIPAHALVPSPLPSSSSIFQPEHKERIGNLIRAYVQDVLCSSKWSHSMKVEEQKIRVKKQSLMLKAMKTLKLKHVGVMISIPDAVSMVAGMLGNMRCARISASVEERYSVSEWCIDMIHRHLCLMNSVCKGVVTEAKLKSATIGLLYMLRQGIVVHELVVLPKLQVREFACNHHIVGLQCRCYAPL